MSYEQELEKKIEQLTKELENSHAVNDKFKIFLVRLEDYINDGLPLYIQKFDRLLKSGQFDYAAKEGRDILERIRKLIQYLK